MQVKCSSVRNKNGVKRFACECNDFVSFLLHYVILYGGKKVIKKCTNGFYELIKAITTLLHSAHIIMVFAIFRHYLDMVRNIVFLHRYKRQQTPALLV